MTGPRPIAGMQYGDFVFCAMDQVVNQAAKMYYMSNGALKVPMVLRLPVGGMLLASIHDDNPVIFLEHTAPRSSNSRGWRL